MDQESFRLPTSSNSAGPSGPGTPQPAMPQPVPVPAVPVPVPEQQHHQSTTAAASPSSTVVVVTTAPPPTYDEDLVENAFFQTLKSKHRKLYARAAEKRHVILVPRSGAVDPAALSKDMIESHVAAPIPVLSAPGAAPTTSAAPSAALLPPGLDWFETANQRRITIDPNRRVVCTDAGFRTRIEAAILFEESFYNSRDESFRVICIARPLLPIASDSNNTGASNNSHNASSSSSSISASSSMIGVTHSLQSYEECMSFLWSDPENEPAFVRINESINLFNATFQFMAHSLRHTIDAAHTIYARGMHAILRTRLGGLARANTTMMATLKLSLETFILDGIHGKIFDGACSTFAQLDTAFNRKTRAMLDLSDKDMDVPAALGLGVSSAVANIARLNMVKTPLEKLHVLRKTIAAITATPPAAGTAKSAAPIVLATDDLLPILILIVVRSDISNWHANMWFMQSFQFASTGTDGLSFMLASFQAAVEHIKSDDFARFVAQRLGLPETLAAGSGGNSSTNGGGSGPASGRRREIAELLGDAGALPGTTTAPESASSGSPSRSRAQSEDTSASSAATATATVTAAAATAASDAAGSRRAFSFSDALLSSPQSASKKRDGLDLLVANMLRGGRAAVESFFKKVSENQQREVRAILAAASLGRRASSMLRLDAIDAPPADAHAPRRITREDIEPQLCHPLCSCPKCAALVATVGRLLDGAGDAAESDAAGGVGDLDSSVTVYSRDGEGCTALHVAARLNLVDMAKLLVDFGAIVNAANYMGGTPLHVACQRNHVDVIRLLLNKGADMAIADNEGNTPLHFAALHGHLECAKELVRNEARGVNALTHVVDVNMANGRGNTALHLASKWGFIDIVQLLLRHGAISDLRNSRNETPLQCAQNRKIVDLIRAETEDDSIHADVYDEQPQQRPTGPAAMQALSRAQPFMMPLNSPTASAGTNKTSNDNSNNHNNTSSPGNPAANTQKPATLRRTSTQPTLSTDLKSALATSTVPFAAGPGHAATGAGATASALGPATPPLISEEQRRHEAEVESLFRAIDDGDIGLVKFRLNIVDAEDGSGPTLRSTPTDTLTLMCHPLCQCDKCSKLQAQPRIGLDINCAHRDGITPLHHACLHGHEEIAAMLLQCGAGVNMRNAHGHTPLHFACQYNHRAVVEKLLNASAKFNAKDRNGNTPLHFCAGNGHIESAELLVRRGANVNVANKRGDTALHTASRWGFGNFVVLLLRHGASTTVLNERNQTPLQCAKSEQVMSLIVSAAANTAFAAYADGAAGPTATASLSTTLNGGGVVAAPISPEDSVESVTAAATAAPAGRPLSREMTALGDRAAAALSAVAAAADATALAQVESAERRLGSPAARSRTASTAIMTAAPPTRTSMSGSMSLFDTGDSDLNNMSGMSVGSSSSSSGAAALSPPRRMRTESLITLRSESTSRTSLFGDEELGSSSVRSRSNSSALGGGGAAIVPVSPSAVADHGGSNGNLFAAASAAPQQQQQPTTMSSSIVMGSGFMPPTKGRAPHVAAGASSAGASELVGSGVAAAAAVASAQASSSSNSTPSSAGPASPTTGRSRTGSSTTAPPPAAAVAPPAAPSPAEAATSSPSQSRTRPSKNVIGDIFNMMETSDLAQGHAQLVESIGSFNKTNLRRPVLTRDLSAPYFDTHLKLSMSINKFNTSQLKRTPTTERVRPTSTAVPADLLGTAFEPDEPQTPAAFRDTSFSSISGDTGGDEAPDESQPSD